MLRLGDKPYDLLIVSLNLAQADGLRLCSQVRSLERTRHLPIIVIVQPGEEARLLRALDMGVNDYLVRPSIATSCSPACARRSSASAIPTTCATGWTRASSSPSPTRSRACTIAATWRPISTALAEQAGAAGRPLSLLLVDIDNFKSINDTYGHEAGDSVLREFAARFRRNTRSIDLACRIGGEEFVIVMPDSGLERACQIGGAPAGVHRQRAVPGRTARRASR